MLDQAYNLRQVGILLLFTFYFLIWSYQPIGFFVTSADEMYGPITTLRRNNRLVKHIPWSAFKMADNDWNRVVDARDILGVRFLFFIWDAKTDWLFRTQIIFSSTFLRRNYLPSGERSPHLKNCSRHGKKNATTSNSISTRMLSQLVWKSWRSIIHGWMKSLVLCWHSVSFFNSLHIKSIINEVMYSPSPIL